MFPSDYSFLWLQKARYRSGLLHRGDFSLEETASTGDTKIQTAIYLKKIVVLYEYLHLASFQMFADYSPYTLRSFQWKDSRLLKALY